MKNLVFVLPLFISLFSIDSYGQLADLLKADLIKEWQGAKEYTKQYLDAMPNEKYNFKPTAGVRTFAEQMLHLAHANTGHIFYGTSIPKIWEGKDLEKRKSAQSSDSVKYFVMSSYDYAIRSITKMDAKMLGERNKIATYDFLRYTWIMGGFKHQIHHRAQTTVYLRLVRVTPPEENIL